MSKIIFWVVVIIVVMVGLRLWNFAKMKSNNPSVKKNQKDHPEEMVQCVRCGVFVPRSEAKKFSDGFHCAEHSDK